MDKIYNSTLEEALDKNIDLVTELQTKIKSFSGYLKGILIAMGIIVLVQFTMLIWLLTK